jgi:hypothetical protein
MTHSGIRGVDTGWLARLLLEQGIDVEATEGEAMTTGTKTEYSDARLATALGWTPCALWPGFWHEPGDPCSKSENCRLGVNVNEPPRYGTSMDATLRDAGPVMRERGLDWAITSDSTEVWTRQNYQSWTHGGTPALAFRNAVIDALEATQTTDDARRLYIAGEDVTHLFAPPPRANTLEQTGGRE